MIQNVNCLFTCDVCSISVIRCALTSVQQYFTSKYCHRNSVLSVRGFCPCFTRNGVVMASLSSLDAPLYSQSTFCPSHSVAVGQHLDRRFLFLLFPPSTLPSPSHPSLRIHRSQNLSPPPFEAEHCQDRDKRRLSRPPVTTAVYGLLTGCH